ncbi:hypothetical protein LguiA_027724 [Lonicera macranthoides]
MKRGKKHFFVDESRRNTYKQTHIPSGPQEPSVMTTFDGQRRQLTAVGLHTNHGFARSLACFGANLGPVAWKVVRERIENSLPAGVKFGLGWVGDIEELQLKSSSLPSTSSTQPNPPSSSLSKPLSWPEISCSTSTSMEIESEKSPDISEGNKLVASTHSTAINGQPNKPRLSSTPTSSPMSGNIFPVRGSANPLRELSSHTNTSTMNSSVNMNRPRPAVQIHHPSMYGYTAPRAGLHLQSHLKHVSVQKNKGTVPPDLNIRFQSPGSPTLSRSDSAQPDLVLQL